MRLLPLLVLAATALPQLMAADPVRYWIKLKDKKGTPYSISRPTEFLGMAAIERR
ncbi:MAG: serine protease, partial [Sphingobacteriia bacterium]|nr:serine protease [Sphingobacteriia bacterium]